MRVSRRKILLSRAPSDPIVAIGNLEAWWDRDGIDGTATIDGDNVDTWTDSVGSRVLNKVTGTQPELEVNGGLRAVRFDGTNAMRIAEWAAVDFQPTVDAFTIIVKAGNDIGTQGTLIGKQLNGSDEIQYQAAIAVGGTAAGKFQLHAGTVTGTSAYTRWHIADPTLAANSVFSFVAGTTDNADVTGYYNTTAAPLDGGISAPFLNSHTNNHDIYVGARWAGSGDTLGFQYDGSIAHILLFSKELNSSEIATVVANLD